MATHPYPHPISAAATGGGAARSHDVDALRGFALLGVVIVNAPFFAHSLEALPEPTALVDRLATWFVFAFGAGKFFPIFSLLFGFGFAVLLARSDARGERVDWSYFRRLTGLLALGAAHAVFLFYGDILVLYALLGFTLWLLRRKSDTTLLVVAGAAMLASIVTQTLVLADYGDQAAKAAAVVEAGPGYLGTFQEATAHRLTHLPAAGFFILLFNGPAAFAMFVLGYVLTRRGWFPFASEQRSRLGRPALLAFGIAAVGSGGAAVPFAAPGALGANGKLLAAVTLSGLAPLLSFALVVGVLGFAARWPERLAVRALAVVGRNSLSGYLLHSVLLGAMFFGWGLGLRGELTSSGVLAAALLTFGLIVALLRVWTWLFRYGPAEWLHRSFTDLRWKPLLRPRATASGHPDVA